MKFVVLFISLPCPRNLSQSPINTWDCCLGDTWTWHWSCLASTQVVQINDRSGERGEREAVHNYIDGNFICKHLYVIRPGVLLMTLSDCKSSGDIGLHSLPRYTLHCQSNPTSDALNIITVGKTAKKHTIRAK